jgi:hypothetical protein
MRKEMGQGSFILGLTLWYVKRIVGPQFWENILGGQNFWGQPLTVDELKIFNILIQ